MEGSHLCVSPNFVNCDMAGAWGPTDIGPWLQMIWDHERAQHFCKRALQTDSSDLGSWMSTTFSRKASCRLKHLTLPSPSLHPPHTHIHAGASVATDGGPWWVTDTRARGRSTSSRCHGRKCRGPTIYREIGGLGLSARTGTFEIGVFAGARARVAGTAAAGAARWLFSLEGWGGE